MPTPQIYGERMAKLEVEVKHVRQDLDDLSKKVEVGMASMQASLAVIQSELTARKEFGRGMKSGIALAYTLAGGALLAGLQKLAQIFGGN